MGKFIIIIIMLSMPVSSVYAKQSHWYSNESNTYGWNIMTPDEQKEHYAKMRRLTSYNDCIIYIEQHDALMKQRAAEKGVDLPALKQNPCDTMKGRRMLK